MCHLKTTARIVILFGICHSLLLCANYFFLSLEKYSPETPLLKEKDLEIKIQGGFVQKIKKQEVVIRAKDLELKLHFKSKKNFRLKVILVNIHPKRTMVDIPSWKIETSSFAKNKGYFFLNLQANKSEIIPVHFKFPLIKPFHFLAGGDAEEGYLALLKLRKKAIAEDPLFLLILGDVVDRGTKFRFQMHQDFFDEIPFPVFSVIGDGELDRNLFKKGLPLEDLFLLYQKFYGSPEFVIHLEEEAIIVGINNLFLKSKSMEIIPSFPQEFRGQKILAAHIPPLDPRTNIIKKKELVHGEEFLKTLVQHNYNASFYGEIHSFLAYSFQEHKVIITGGLGGKKLPNSADYHFVKVSLEKESLDAKPIFIHLNRIEEWFNKQAFWWWSWFYLFWKKPFWRLLHFLLICFYLRKIKIILKRKVNVVA